eukprot:c11657_g1_i1 orf=79-840(+)
MEALLCDLEEEQESEAFLCDRNGSQQEHFYSLTVDLWRTILQKLPVNYLAQAACVCHLWHSIANDHVMLSSRFKETWKLAQIVGKPLSSSFWHDANLGRFAISHTVKQWDTVAGLAVRYQVHVIEIKRLNNMMSEHGIYSRQRLLIPVLRQELVEGKTCYIEADPYAKREVAVLYLEGGQPKHTFFRRSKPRTEKRCRKGVLESMKRSLQEDDATVHYYLSLADGDIKEAYSKYNEDLRWERSRISRVFPCFG